MFSARGMISLQMAGALVACQSLPGSTASEMSGVRPGSLNCAPDGLKRRALQPGVVEPSLEFVEGPPHHMRVAYVNLVEGTCARLVAEAQQNVIRLRDGSTFMLNDDGMGAVSWPQARGAFGIDDLDMRNVPLLEGQRFLGGDDYLTVPTALGREQRYIGLWGGKRRWTVAAFAVSPAGVGEIRCVLLHSKLPVRGVTFFPSPDQPSGGIWLVQEGPGQQIRTIAVSWRHAGVSASGPNGPC